MRTTKKFLRVHAGEYNHTHINLKVGDEVFVESEPEDCWFDMLRPSDADGWNSWVFDMPVIKKFKNFPDENFMKLCAKIGDQKVAIGSRKKFTLQTDGELILFANDIDCLRWNNSGHIDVTIYIRTP